ncbi:PH domain-containing protein [Dactylosporangium cerinum]|uniref:PH domain-containing protein n=1 Tax=Dactylosporangium cerinum TaxID=1434730 RepID=A0ABV9WBP6_9ACTN
MTFAWRVAATAAAVATLVALVVDKFVIVPLTWHIEPDALRLGVVFPVVMLAGAGPTLALLWLGRRLLKSPATFQRSADGAAFVVPDGPVWPGNLACTLMLVAGMAVPYERAPNSERIQLPTDPGFGIPLLAIGAVLATVALAIIWLPAPSVRLTPTGITVRGAFRSRDLRWEDLVPGGPHPPGQWTMRLLYRTDGRQKRFSLRTYRMRVDGTFLATVVRHYAEQPEHRAAIGTQAELERLESAYASWKAAPALLPKAA